MRILFALFFLTGTSAYGQMQKRSDPDTQTKTAMLTDSLAGKWELVKTICYINGDTVVQEVSFAAERTAGSKLPARLTLDTLQNFTITRWCMKCPHIAWSGRYEIKVRPLKDMDFFYLTFVEQRDKRSGKKVSLTADFNGHITDFSNGKLQLTNDNGCHSIYKRVTDDR